MVCTFLYVLWSEMVTSQSSNNFFSYNTYSTYAYTIVVSMFPCSHVHTCMSFRSGHLPVVMHLVGEVGVDPNITNKNGETPLYLACR